MRLLKKYLNRPGNESLRAKMYAAASFLRAQPRPILVYQMSKVGSTSVSRALRAAGYHPLHVHTLAPDGGQDVEVIYDNVDLKPAHYYTERLLRPYLNWTRHQLTVISLVRDPIARHLSAAFQWPHRRSIVPEGVEGARQMIAERLSRPGSMDYTFNWFDEEIKAVLGVDVLRGGFNRTEGYGEYHGSRARVLVVKLERLSELLPTVISDFVRAPTPLQEVRANAGGQKSTGEVYAEVKNTLRLPEATCEDIYGHPWVRHFYTEAEVATFKRRWGGVE